MGPESTSSSTTVATVSDLSVTFERDGEQLRALRGVNLSIKSGEVLGLVGESGSGKSVLGSTILGLLPKTVSSVSGRVEVDGVDMINGQEGQRRRVRRLSLGAVFQDPMTSLNPTKRIGRQLLEVTGSDAVSIELLDAVGIPAAAQRLRSFPHELSGGLRQRVMIAMALAGKPRLLVADEPTTALDVSVQAQILDLLRDLCTDLGLGILFVTHDLGVASQISDRIAVLYNGRLAELGPAAEVLDRPTHPYSSALRGSRLTMESDRSTQLLTLEGEPPSLLRSTEACPFAPRCRFQIEECTHGLPELRPTAGPSESACIREGSLDLDWKARDAGDPWPVAAVPPTGNVLSVVDARKTYRLGRGKASVSLNALDGVDLSVRHGEAVSVVGLSGCGKSTLLRSIAGLVTLDAGEIDYQGETPPQIVFQDAGSSLTPWLSVGEVIGERLRGGDFTKAERQARVAEVMERVGLPASLAPRRPTELSGGQRQRAAIARAIMVPPSLLLCDEPTSALDVSLAATVLNLLGRLRRELGIAMLFVTHDLAAARLIGDRIVVMEGGRIVEDGAAQDVTDNPQHDLTKSLLAALPGAGKRRMREELLTTVEDPHAALLSGDTLHGS
jgi:peptide/nickel transport system ATP-binding protein